MTHRFIRCKEIRNGEPILTDGNGRFKGTVITHAERLSLPIKRKKPTAYAVWNDFWHESVPDDFQYRAFEIMASQECGQHTFLILTKRPQIAAAFFNEGHVKDLPLDHVYHGLTVCNQQEIDEKIPIFLQVPGKKFLSIEPMLGAIDLARWLFHKRHGPLGGGCLEYECAPGCHYGKVDAVILGGETLGNRPGREMKLEWAESITDQCEAAGVPLFVKQLHVNGRVSKNMSDWPLKLQRRELPWLKKDR